MTKNFVRIGIIVTACAFALIGSANAQLLTESFAYSDPTPLVGTGGWEAASGAGTNPMTATGATLTYPGLTTSGLSVPYAASGEDITRDWGSPVASPGVIYFSALVNITTATAAGDYILHLTTGAFGSTTFHGRVFVRSSGAGYQYGIRARSGGTITYETAVRTFGTTDFIVVHYNMNTAPTLDTVDLIVNPALTGVEPPPSASEVGNTGEQVPPVGLNRIGLRQGGAATSPGARVDELRVGTTWASVVPSGSAVGDWEMYD